MANLTVEKARALANGDKQVAGFSGGIRSLENVALELNDTFTFPTSYEVFEQKIGDNKVQYIWVTLENGNAKRFYPSTFTKTRTVFNEDGTSTGVRKYTLGTAAEEFRKHGTVEEGMRALAGKKVKVTNIEVVSTLRYNSDKLQNTQIPTIDIVEK